MAREVAGEVDKWGGRRATTTALVKERVKAVPRKPDSYKGGRL